MTSSASSNLTSHVKIIGGSWVGGGGSALALALIGDL